jgi:hypothetical protein
MYDDKLVGSVKEGRRRRRRGRWGKVEEERKAGREKEGMEWEMETADEGDIPAKQQAINTPNNKAISFTIPNNLIQRTKRKTPFMLPHTTR